MFCKVCKANGNDKPCYRAHNVKRAPKRKARTFNRWRVV